MWYPQKDCLVWYLAGGEDLVDVLEEALVLHLFPGLHLGPISGLAALEATHG